MSPILYPLTDPCGSQCSDYNFFGVEFGRECEPFACLYKSMIVNTDNVASQAIVVTD
jgi:hypothetical protein